MTTQPKKKVTESNDRNEIEHEVVTLTQEHVDTQNKAHLAPISQQLIDLRMIIQNLTKKPPS